MEAQKISIPTQQLFLKVSVHKFVLKFVNQSECQEVCQLQHLCRRKFQFAFTNLYSTIISLTQTPHLPCLSHIMILFQCAYFGSLIDTLYFLCKLLAFFDYCCAKQNQKHPRLKPCSKRETFGPYSTSERDFLVRRQGSQNTKQATGTKGSIFFQKARVQPSSV